MATWLMARTCKREHACTRAPADIAQAKRRHSQLSSARSISGWDSSYTPSISVTALPMKASFSSDPMSRKQALSEKVAVTTAEEEG